MHEVFQNMQIPEEGNLGINSEDTYQIIEVGGKGTYNLATLDGVPILKC